MEVRATGKYVKISPLKARTAVGVMKGKNAMQAYYLLKHMPQKSAGALAKVLTSAMANAENNHNLDREALTVKEAYVDNGPRYKRIQPRARGSAFGILRKTSHITVVVFGEKESRKIKKAELKEEEKKIETLVEQKVEKVETQNIVETKVKEAKIEKTETVKEEEKQTLKDLAKDRVKKETGDKKTVKQEEGFKGESRKSDHEKGGFWNKFFRRKTG